MYEWLVEMTLWPALRLFSFQSVMRGRGFLLSLPQDLNAIPNVHICSLGRSSSWSMATNSWVPLRAAADHDSIAHTSSMLSFYITQNGHRFRYQKCNGCVHLNMCLDASEFNNLQLHTVSVQQDFTLDHLWPALLRSEYDLVNLTHWFWRRERLN